MTDTLTTLEAVIAQRRGADTEKSYVAKRLKQGTAKIAQKMGEEAVETIIAAMQKDHKELISESADLMFHWLLLLADGGVTVAQVMAELESRAGESGLDEKARRKLKE